MIQVRDYGSAFRTACIAAVLAAGTAPAGAAEPEQSGKHDTSDFQGASGETVPHNENDFSRSENSLELRTQFRESSGTNTQTDRERELIRLAGPFQLSSDWKLEWFAQAQLLNKDIVSSNPTSSESEFGLGDSLFQAALIQTLSERWAYGFGARLAVPTAQDDLGSGKWTIMPLVGVRYSLTELGSDSHFLLVVRYAVSVAGESSKRDMNELQIAPTLNLDLPDRWFVTLYPTNDIRINLGDPVSGQTGRLFLPAEFAIGHHLTDKLQMSLEIGLPIIKQYPVYDFKAEFRIVIKQ